MCELADKYNAENNKNKVDAVRECIDIVHNVFYRFNEQKYRVANRLVVPANECEEAILEMNGLKIFELKGGKRLYEADGRQFQSAREVIVYLIQCWKEKIEGMIRQEKFDFLKAVQKMMKELEPSGVMPVAGWRVNRVYSISKGYTFKGEKTEDEEEYE